MRSFDRNMPEELNRIIVDQISDMLFVPTRMVADNLKNEGIPEGKIEYVYDISVDACMKGY